MATNQFENSRVAEGTLPVGGMRTGTPWNESSTVSRDDARDGFDDPSVSRDGSFPDAQPANARHLLAASTMTGDRVRNLAGEDLGNIEEIMIDPQSGRIEYAVLSFGGFLGIGDKFFAVPWGTLRIDTGEHEFVLDVDRNTLESAPGFDKSDWPDMADPAFGRAMEAHYGSALANSKQKGDNMAKVTTMEELFLDEIRDLYDAETQLTKALPKMAKAAWSEELRNAFETHLRETENQVDRLERIFEAIGEKASGKKCAAMAGLIKEGDEMASSTDESAVRDAGLIAAAQKVEHYEMSGYGSARTHAEILGNTEAVRLLEETLQEEKAADKKLNGLATGMINQEAAGKTRTAGGSNINW